jgi:hypothetical protein
MVTFPTDTPVTDVTKPVDDTVAMLGLLLFHQTFLFAALDGETVAVIVSILPTARLVEVLFNDTPFTAALPEFSSQ